jgi:ubiquinone/menaquinone biosynthesis C-methylase UbiE
MVERPKCLKCLYLETTGDDYHCGKLQHRLENFSAMSFHSRYCGEKENKRVLNVGCGDDTFGTDFVDLYPIRGNVIMCDVTKEKLPYEDNTFDVVYSKNLLEHLSNLWFALKEMKRVLKKNGKENQILEALLLENKGGV